MSIQQKSKSAIFIGENGEAASSKQTKHLTSVFLSPTGLRKVMPLRAMHGDSRQIPLQYPFSTAILEYRLGTQRNVSRDSECPKTQNVPGLRKSQRLADGRSLQRPDTSNAHPKHARSNHTSDEPMRQPIMSALHSLSAPLEQAQPASRLRGLAALLIQWEESRTRCPWSKAEGLKDQSWHIQSPKRTSNPTHELLRTLKVLNGPQGCGSMCQAHCMWPATTFKVPCGNRYESPHNVAADDTQAPCRRRYKRPRNAASNSIQVPGRYSQGSSDPQLATSRR